MSKLISSSESFMTNGLLADVLQDNFSKIMLQWKSSPSLQETLKIKEIDPDFFINHFGNRILSYFISVLRGEQKAGQCPVIMVMLKFFHRRNLTIENIYKICSAKRNSVIYTLLESGMVELNDLVKFASDLFDANFSGVIHGYADMVCEVQEENAYALGTACSIANNNAVADDKVLLKEYFAHDEEEYKDERVLFRTDDADDLMEYFSEASERISFAIIHSNTNEITTVAHIFSHISSILLHYSPYLDTLSESMSELSTALLDHTKEFMEILQSAENNMLTLFDAISADMDRYIERFSIESMVMKNSHHIHEPTTLSIRQIITMFAPDQVEAGEVEFF